MLVLVPVLLLVLVKVLALPAVGVVELLVLLRSIVEGLYHGGASTVDTGPKIKNINKSMHIRVYIYRIYHMYCVYIYICDCSRDRSDPRSHTFFCDCVMSSEYL